MTKKEIEILRALILAEAGKIVDEIVGTGECQAMLKEMADAAAKALYTEDSE